MLNSSFSSTRRANSKTLLPRGQNPDPISTKSNTDRTESSAEKSHPLRVFSGLGLKDNPLLVFFIVVVGYLIHEVVEHSVPASLSGWIGHTISFGSVLVVAGLWAYALLKSHKRVRTTLIGQLKSRELADERLTETIGDLKASVKKLDSRTQQFEALSAAMQKLQSCESDLEMCESLGAAMPDILPSSAGALYILSDNFFELAAKWPTEVGLPLKLLRRNWLRGLRGCGDAASTEEHWHPADPGKGWQQIPFKAGKEFVGMIQVRSADGNENSSDALVLRMLIEQVNTSVSNIRLRESLTRQALRDPLTALYNRRYMEDCLNRELGRANREKSSVAVIMFDLDHFKNLNDTYGHAIGDLVLKEVAAVTRKNIREHDIACRYGGEEFIVILPGAPAVVAMQRAEQIRWAIRELKFDIKGKERLRVTASFGVAAFPKNASNVKVLIGASDAALYQSKSAGRNRVTVAE